MQSSLASIPLTIGLVGAAALSLWIAIREFRRSREQSLQTETSWPFEFPVYWLDYYLGPRLARFCRLGQVAVYTPIFVMGAIDAMSGDGAYGQLMLMNLVIYCCGAVSGFLPLTCRFDERGITLQKQLFPWETIRRWNVSDRRLQFVAARAQNRKLTFTLEIPLNGLSPSLASWVEEQIAAHAAHPALVASSDAPISTL